MINKKVQSLDSISNHISSRIQKFQKLDEEPTQLIVDKGSPSSFNTFYHDLKETSLLYEELWEELSSCLPDFVTVAEKSQNIYENIESIKHQWNSLETSSKQNPKLNRIYHTFCDYVLYDSTMHRENKNLAPFISPSQDAQKDGFDDQQQNPDPNHGNSHFFESENDEILISTIINPLYGKNQNQDKGYQIPSGFNGREEFLNLIKTKELPKKVERKKKEILAISICPFFFMVILLFFVLGKNYQNHSQVFDTHFRKTQFMFDLDSKINNAFLWKENIIENSLAEIKQDISNSLDNLINLEAIIKAQRQLEPLKSLKKENNLISLWTPENKMLELDYFETTTILLESVHSFLSFDENLSREDQAYLFWSHNFHNQYYLTLKNLTSLSFSGMKEHTRDVPFNALLGILFFFCTIIIIFINFLYLCNIFALNSHVLSLYLCISQPELDTFKQNIRAFLRFLEDNCGEKDDNEISAKEHLFVSHCSSPSSKRIRVGSLKRFQSSRSLLESKLYGLTGLLIICSFLLFLIPIPLQKKLSNTSDHYLKKLSILSDIEISYLFLNNGLKQELIIEIPLLGNKDPLPVIKESNNQLNELLQNITLLETRTHQKVFSEYERIFQDTLNGEFCDKMIDEEKKSCKKFQNGQLNEGLLPLLNRNVKFLSDITTKFEQSRENSMQNDMILREMQSLQLDSFGEKYLRKGFQILRENLPESLKLLFAETSQKIITLAIIISIVWIVVILILYFKVILPLYIVIKERKKLICLIPFHLLIKMEEDLTEFIEDFCELPLLELHKEDIEKY